MKTRTKYVMLPVYYQNTPQGVSARLADYPGVWCRRDTLEEALADIKDQIRMVAKVNGDMGRGVPWQPRSPIPAGWSTDMLRVRFGPPPVIKWYHRVIEKLLYVSGWALFHGVWGVERIAGWLESKRRK